LINGAISHDQVTRMLLGKKQSSREWWLFVKPYVRQRQCEDGVLIVDDPIEEKPYTDENDIICWHYDHAKGCTVKVINFITALYHAQDVFWPVGFEIVSKTEWYEDKKTGKKKWKSKETKNERYRCLLKQAVQNEILSLYVLNGIWFASAGNMRLVKLDSHKDFIMGLKENRKVALSEEARARGQAPVHQQTDVAGRYACHDFPGGGAISFLSQPPALQKRRWLDGGALSVISDLSLIAGQIVTIYQKRWNTEEYHQSLKQNASLAKSSIRTETTQTNHFVAALRANMKLEWLKVQMKRNYYQLKSQLYLSALPQAFKEIRRLQYDLAFLPLTAQQKFISILSYEYSIG